MALADIVPAPPRIKLMEVTTNSAKNKTPPLLPTNCPTKKARITTVTKLNSFNMEPVLLLLPMSVTEDRPFSIEWTDTLMPRLILQEKTVTRFNQKWGELEQKLPRATAEPIKTLRAEDSLPTSRPWSRLSAKMVDPCPAVARAIDRCSGKFRLRQKAMCFIRSSGVRRFQ